MRLESGGLPCGKVLHGRHHVQGSMRSEVVVEVLVFGEGSAGCGDGEFAGVEVPELDAGAVVGSFDAAIELRSSGRQDKLRDVELLASLLELGPELGAAVDLDGMEGEGQVLDHGLQETLGRYGRWRGNRHVSPCACRPARRPGTP